ncbi:glycosyltransferase [Akkermansiaceae bacterium]|nr:glycosyltransferase [Akkermansiaceae bacterium]MDB4423425.1 glycosyltransferase [bacterium]
METQNSGEEQKKVDVSISCLTFNHEEYIRDTLDGFLMQQTEYSFEILIHDDASTDGTANIIREYEARYPNLIKPIYQKNNQYSRGLNGGMNHEYQFPRARGRYYAFCEGDDFWTDPNKLQIQVKFLEDNPDYSLCYHNYHVLKGEARVLHSKPKLEDMELKDYANGLAGIQTLTVVARNIYHGLVVPANILQFVTGSYFWFILAAASGKMKYIDTSMAVYRVNPSGIWSGKSKGEQGRMSLSNKYAMILYFAADREVCCILKDVYVKSASYYCMSALRSLDFASVSYFFRLSMRFGIRRVHFTAMPTLILKKMQLVKS